MAVKPGYKQTEVGVIPEDWDVKQLRNISPTQSVGLVINPSSYFDDAGTVPMLVGSHIKENAIFGELANRISQVSNQLLTSSRLAAGDIVMVRVGEPGVTAVIPPELDGCNCASMMIVRQHRSFNSHWLCYLMNSRLGRSQVEHVQYGTAQKQFNISDAVNFLYPCPPLREQQAIAEALSDVDGLISALDGLIAKKRAIKGGAMQELLTGQRRLPGFAGEWEVKTLGACLLTNPAYGINAPAVSYSDNLPIYVRITDITDDGTFSPDKIASVENVNSGKYLLELNDVVFARTGASTGKTYLYNPKDGVMAFAGFLIRVKTDPLKLLARYLAYYTQTQAYWNWVTVMSMRSGQPGINGNEYSQLPILLPPLAEQTAIAQILADMDAELAALVQKREKTVALKQGLMQTLLTGQTRLV